MNATRAASIRLRAAFDGAVSLGRVQTPTLALIARREEEIRAFKPEPYWLVEAKFAASGERAVLGPLHRRQAPRGGKEAAAVVEACTGQPGEITKLEKKEERERSQLLYDLTSLQRHANTLYGFSARRTLGAAQKLYEEHKALTYPRTNSRFLTGDMARDIRPTAELVGHNPAYRKGAEYVTSLEKLPLGRVVNDKKVEDHHAMIPTKSEHDLGRMGADELKVYDLVDQALPRHLPPRRGVRAHARGDDGRRARLPHQRRRLVVAAGSPSTGRRLRSRSGRGRLRWRPDAAQARPGRGRWRRATSSRCGRRPSRRGATPRRRCWRRWRPRARTSRTTRLREAMKESGIGTPATRAATIELLIWSRVHRARGPRAARDREGHPGDPPTGRASADLGRADRRLGAPPGADRARRGLAPGIHEGHRQVHHRDGGGAGQAQGRQDRAGEARARARSAAARSWRTARATRAGRARTRAAAS